MLSNSAPLVYYVLNVSLYSNPTVSLGYSIFLRPCFFPYPVHAIFVATLNPRPSPPNMHNRDTIEYLKLYNPLVSWIWQEGWVCCPCTKSSGEIATPPPNLLHMEPIYLSDSSSACFLACMLVLLEPSCNKARASAS